MATSIVDHLKNETQMRLLQHQIERHVVLLSMLNERDNAVYESFDRLNRFNMRVLRNDRFGVKVALRERSSVTVDDFTT